jgi:hypothetical protein
MGFPTFKVTAAATSTLVAESVSSFQAQIDRYACGTCVAGLLCIPLAINKGASAMALEPIRGATDDVLRRVQGEFLEMPGLRLTQAQARRLWGLEASACDALLGALVDAKFLFRTRDGAFMRVEHATPVKAAMRPRKTAAVA